MSRNRRKRKYKGKTLKKRARSRTLFCDKPGRVTTGTYLRSERYRRINAMRDDLSVLPDDEGNIIISRPENAATAEELERRHREELAAEGLEPGYWKH